MTLFVWAHQLVGPLTAVHQVKAHSDCKGNKTDLTLKQGECLDIIRVQGNPEGKWLGRSQDGSSEWSHGKIGNDRKTYRASVMFWGRGVICETQCYHSFTHRVLHTNQRNTCMIHNLINLEPLMLTVAARFPQLVM